MVNYNNFLLINLYLSVKFTDDYFIHKFLTVINLLIMVFVDNTPFSYNQITLTWFPLFYK